MATATFEPQHLAELIEEEMTERGWKIGDLVMNMGPHFTELDWNVCQLSWEMFMAVREPNILLGDRMAEQLSDAFDVSPKFFTNFHEMWRSWAKAHYESSKLEAKSE
jgi:plasmid maintenance system antidote protein VapI